MVALAAARIRILIVGQQHEERHAFQRGQRHHALSGLEPDVAGHFSAPKAVDEGTP